MATQVTQGEFLHNPQIKLNKLTLNQLTMEQKEDQRRKNLEAITALNYNEDSNDGNISESSTIPDYQQKSQLEEENFSNQESQGRELRSSSTSDPLANKIKNLTIKKKSGYKQLNRKDVIEIFEETEYTDLEEREDLEEIFLFLAAALLKQENRGYFLLKDTIRCKALRFLKFLKESFKTDNLKLMKEDLDLTEENSAPETVEFPRNNQQTTNSPQIVVRSTQTEPGSPEICPLNYAKALKSPPKSNQTILIYPNNKETKLEKVLEEKLGKKNSKFKSIKKIRNRGLAITMNSEEDLEEMKIKLEEEETSNICIKVPFKRNPKLIIYNVPEDIVEEDIQKELLTDEEGSTAIYKFKLRGKNGNTHMVFEVSPNINRKIKKSRSVAVGWTVLTAREFHSIRRCFNCQCFGHISVDCPNKSYCGKCSEGHKTESCKSRYLNCANCDYSNYKFGTNLNTDHAAWDRKCPCYLEEIKREKKFIKTE